MSSTGQFHIARDIFNDWTSEDKPWCALALWLYLIGRGQYRDTVIAYLGHPFSLTRGQLVTSVSHLCDMAGWTPQRLRTFLARCVKDDKITVTGTPSGTVITVLNYDKWQAPIEQQTIQQSKQQTSTQSMTDNMPTEQQTIQQSKQQQSIQKSLVSKEDLEDIVEQKENLLDAFLVKPSKPKRKSKDTAPEVTEVLSYLNLKISSRYSVAPDLVARFKQGATVEQAKAIIDKKVAEWAGTEMAPWLKPSTLFCKKHFDEYLNQPGIQSVGKLFAPIPIWTEEQDTKHKEQGRKWLDDNTKKEEAR